MFAWPICACLALLIFGLFFVSKFKKEISRFIDRTQKVTREGVEAGTTPIVTQEIKDIVRPSPADELLRIFDNQLLLEQEGVIGNYLAEKSIENPAERERVLVRYLASSYIGQRFESVYHSIWGSQLRALQQLNESQPGGVLLSALEPWYELGKALQPAWYANYSYMQWYGFMEGMTLVVSAGGTVHITLFGHEFLKYIIQCSYPLEKLG